MLASISFNQSHKSNMSHNNREHISGNKDIDESRSHLNLYFVQKDIREVYEEVFGEAVEAYNVKQKREDRKIQDYYEKVHNDKKTHEQRELIVAIGEGKDGEEFRAGKREALIKYAEEFQGRNPNLAVYNLVLHDDEANPHLHINYVPHFESKRGLTRRVGMDKALQQQGVKLGEKENSTQLISHWREKETSRIEELAKEHIPGFKRANVGSHKYMKVKQFKEFKEEAKKVKEETKDLASKAYQLAEFHDKLNDRVKTLVERNKALESEVERKKALVKEYVQRVEVLVSETKQGKKPKPKRYHVAMSELIYQPEVKTELLRARTVKMTSEDYNKMLASQRNLEKNHVVVVKNFNVLADMYYQSEMERQRLAAELEKANKAIPIRNEYFVPVAELQKAQKEIQERDKIIQAKDKIIEEQEEHINSLEKTIMRCAEFIRDMRKQAFDLVNDLAQRMRIVPLVNKLIKQEKEQIQVDVEGKTELPKKQKSRADDWSMER